MANNMCKTNLLLVGRLSDDGSSDCAAFRRLLKKVFKDFVARGGLGHLALLGFLKCTGLQGLLGQQVFCALDRDRDGVLSQAEFVSGFLALYHGSYQEVGNFLFKVLDFGGRGYVTLRCLKGVARYLPAFCGKCGAKNLRQCEVMKEVKALFAAHPILTLEETVAAISAFPSFFESLLQALTASLPAVFDQILSPQPKPTENTSDGLCVLQRSSRRYFGELREETLYLYVSAERQRAKAVITLRGLFPEPVGSTGVALKDGKFQYLFEATSEFSRDQWIERLLHCCHFRWFDDYYEIGAILGSGSYGQVVKAYHRLTRTPAAVKIINKEPLDDMQEIRLRREMDALRLCKHENLVELYDIFETNDRVYIVCEYLSGGSLFDYLQQRNFQVSESFSRLITRDLANGLRFLHKLGIVHRDVKLENILLTTCGTQVRGKLIDFGLCTFLGPDHYSNEAVGTLKYASPEVVSRLQYREKVDNWSLGVVLYILLRGRLPFAGKNDEEVARSIVGRRANFEVEAWGSVSVEALKVAKSLLARRAERRMTLKEVMESRWLCDRELP